MTKWEHEPGDKNNWECWAHVGGQLRVMAINEPGYLFNGRTLYALGYYIVVNGNYDHPDVLPLDTPIDDVLAAAIVIARMSTP